MEVEKRGKGGFLQLFDWNGKSRKKLFTSKPDLPVLYAESSNHGKDNCHGSVIARRQLVLDQGLPLNTTCDNDYPYASSASGDSEQGTKAPGVVARLMGLDSLPTSNVIEPCSNPFSDSYSFRDSSYLMAAPAFHGEHDIVIFESVRNKLDGSSRNPLDLRLQKVQNRHIERFQREVLPPKSAKPMSVTHNRLMSPIKSPGFIPPKNAAYIIEAASKIIDQSPRSTTKGNFSSLGLPPGSFRVRDLKEKLESTQRTSQSANASQKEKEENSKNIKKQLNARGKGRLEDNYQYKGSEESKRASSQKSKSNEKPVSLAVQTKPSIHKRDGSTSSGSRSSEKQKEHNGCVTGDLPHAQKKVEKQTSSRKPSEALRLNNQKQNRASGKDEENFESSCSQPKERQVSSLSSNYINGRTSRTVNKIVVDSVATSRKTNFVVADPGKEVSSVRAKTTSKKRLPINRNIQSSGGVFQKAMAIKDEKSVKFNVSFEGDSKWDGIDRKSSFDVVSFTFTSPIKKSVGSISSAAILEATSSSSPSYDPCVRESDLRSSATSSSGFNVIGGDALSVLLEEKLKELTSRVEFSQKDVSGSSSLSVNNYANMGPAVNLVESPLHMDNSICKKKQEAQDASDCDSVNKPWYQAEQGSKGLDYFEGAGDSKNFQRHLYLQGSTSLSSQPSLSGASCDSFGRSSSDKGMDWRSTRKPCIAEVDPEISDTASSLSVGSMSETVSSSLHVVESKDSSNWELKYIEDILSHAELLLEEFSLGQAHQIVAPDLFMQLENQTMESYKGMEENVVERKVLFDCVCECLEQRCGRILDGGPEFWGKQVAVLRKRQWLADDLYREIWRWTNTDELMVDELVDKDMSSKNGRWVDFEVEGFEGGVEIGSRILTCLVDELIDDFLL
ncbi:serine-rich adhesin for platelets-like [Salvia divinorum]|uniref:Serine-rich adhesin for platelets-like n=1 Tax=Salvia divinorum TaxID=28513 RepID=A0ABD1GPX9_SALDI